MVVLLHLCSQLTNWDWTSLSPLDVGDLKVSIGFNTLLSCLQVLFLFRFEHEYVCRAFLKITIKFTYCSIFYSSHVNVWALKSHGVPVAVVTK